MTYLVPHLRPGPSQALVLYEPEKASQAVIELKRCESISKAEPRPLNKKRVSGMRK